MIAITVIARVATIEKNIHVLLVLMLMRHCIVARKHIR
jgi:hypothetical protein